MSVETLRDLVAQLSASATTLAALGATLHARASGKPMHADLQARTDELLQAAGAAQALDGVSPAEAAPLLAELRHFWKLDDEFLFQPGRAPGWTTADAEALQIGGEITEGFAQVLPRLLPQLDGLGARLTAGAAFLDVGTGVGRLSIALARQFPALRAVGVDVSAPALAVARKNVADAGMQGRVALREQRAEALADEEAFDLAWIPAPFIHPSALATVVERVQRALKPGGWLLFAAAKPGDDVRGAALRLRVALYGGAPGTQAETEALLTSKGFARVKTLPGPPKDFKMIVAAQR